MSEQQSEAGSEPTGEDGPMTVTDDDLPEDLRPADDNPLAQPAGDDVPDDVLKDTSEKRPLEEKHEPDESDGEG